MLTTEGEGFLAGLLHELEDASLVTLIIGRIVKETDSVLLQVLLVPTTVRTGLEIRYLQSPNPLQTAYLSVELLKSLAGKGSQGDPDPADAVSVHLTG